MTTNNSTHLFTLFCLTVKDSEGKTLFVCINGLGGYRLSERYNADVRAWSDQQQLNDDLKMIKWFFEDKGWTKTYSTPVIQEVVATMQVADLISNKFWKGE